MQKTEQLVKSFSEKNWKELSKKQREELAEIIEHKDNIRDVNKEYIEYRTIGQRAADGIARIAGSWAFIILFVASILLWAIVNTEILGPRREAFDPYPYIFLNLILCMLAAAQGPIIMMSQNRQGARDRLDAEIDHEVNLRAEIAIQVVDDRVQALEKKLDNLTQLLLIQDELK